MFVHSERQRTLHFRGNLYSQRRRHARIERYCDGLREPRSPNIESYRNRPIAVSSAAGGWRKVEFASVDRRRAKRVRGATF